MQLFGFGVRVLGTMEQPLACRRDPWDRIFVLKTTVSGSWNLVGSFGSLHGEWIHQILGWINWILGAEMEMSKRGFLDRNSRPLGSVLRGWLEYGTSIHIVRLVQE